MKKILFWNISAIILFQFVLGQPSGQEYHRFGIMDGNNVKTVIGNWGVVGQPAGSGPRGAWLYESNGYIGEESILLGLELPIRDYNLDGKLDTIHSVITCPVARPTQKRDEDPITNLPWTFEPVSGFANALDTSIALSNNPSSWPASWSGQWNGMFGMGNIIANLEAYYQLDDQNDKRFNFTTNNIYGVSYHPDTNNLSKTGHGIRVDVRYLQFNHPLFSDVLFKVYDIKNECSFNYDKVVFGDIVGTYVGVTGTDGGPQEYNDDYSVLYKKENVIISGDIKQGHASRNPKWYGPIGMFGSAFIQGQIADSITSYHYVVPPNTIILGDDGLMWNKLTPGSFSYPGSIVNDTVVLAGEDGDCMFGSQYFTLASGESKRIIVTTAYGFTPQEIFQKIKLANVLHNNNFDTTKVGTHLQLTNLHFHTSVSGNYQIEWNSEKIASTVDIDFSPDAGRTWRSLEKGISNNLSYQWNTASVADCPFGIIRIYMKDALGKYIDFVQSGFITVDNAGNGKPFIKMLDDVFYSENPLQEKTIDVSFLIGDPENSPQTLQVLYDAGYEIHSNAIINVVSDTIHQKVTINLESIPNSNVLQLRFVLSDGTLTDTVSTPKFKKQTERSFLPKVNATYIHQNVTDPSVMTINVVDRSKVTNDTYIVSFIDTTIIVDGIPTPLFTVYNSTQKKIVLKDIPLIPYTESPAFDGLSFFPTDILTKVQSTTWNRNVLSSVKVFIHSNSLFNGTLTLFRNPVDYKLVFYGNIVDTSIAHPSWPGLLDATPLRFKLINQKTGKAVKVYWYSEDKQSIFDSQLIAVEDILGQMRPTWTMFIPAPMDTSLHIQAGDTVNITMAKGISRYDSISISNVALKVGYSGATLPDVFSLSQNYPNPFNPSTIIRYNLPTTVDVSLKVFDILGREVATLVNVRQNAGAHEVTFDARRLSSGIYFYRLTAGSYSAIKKLMLLK
ncbi:MAG: T9SS type A sorting domain-containing protein [Bacteroidota bacterium]